MSAKLKAWLKLLLYNDIAYPDMETFRKKKEVVDTQRRKVTDIIVASVFTKNKKS